MLRFERIWRNILRNPKAGEYNYRQVIHAFLQPTFVPPRRRYHSAHSGLKQHSG